MVNWGAVEGTQELGMIAGALDRWFQAQGRDYPWRRTQDAYAVLVSEMMLQQTQIATVLERGYYTRWMERFPTLAALAAADEAAVLRTWEGLGYYRRARFLQQLARVVMERHGGVFPQELESIRALPGVGAYTAGAVASFAFGTAAPLVDGNVARVLMRLTDDATPVDGSIGQKRLWMLAAALMEQAASPRRHNSALMELGQTICRSGRPDCIRCPVKTWCRAEEPAALPVKGKRTAVTEVTERVYFREEAGRVLLEQEGGRRRTGLWKLPALPEELGVLPAVLHRSRYAITRYRVALWVHEAPAGGEILRDGMRLVDGDELRDLPMASPYRRALDAVLGARDFRLEG